VDYVWGVQNRRVSDVETMSGVYNDEILVLIDQLMLEVQQFGLKLVISLHDHWYLVCEIIPLSKLVICLLK
jgi:hypothetical protein